jgi:glycerol-3-phosphate dehydrogenase
MITRVNREQQLQRLTESREPFDLVIVGGGATGAGVALDAASRGYRVALLEAHDFGKGTSSRSTKLIHGGVRYLEQGNLKLVREALRERAVLEHNAPSLVERRAFIVPGYEWWEAPYFGAGLMLYAALAGKQGFGSSRWLSREQVLEDLPGIEPEGLKGGALYWDGQFDDARLLIAIVRTAHAQGAVVLNYMPVLRLMQQGDDVQGVVARDEESGAEVEVAARLVINATGPFADALRPANQPRLIAASQGVHLVFDSSFLPSSNAMLVPRTRDGRVMFAIPWLGHVVIGTTDTPIDRPVLEPEAQESEIDLILETASQYLARKPKRADILSVFTGIRPLVRAAESDGRTAELARDHIIREDAPGLLTITGGKWTTYRAMAEECVDRAILLADLPSRSCVTEDLPLEVDLAARQREASKLDPNAPYTDDDVRRAVRLEMARTVEDVLARRTRLLFLRSDAAVECAPRVAELMAAELGRDGAWVQEQVEAFERTSRSYRPRSAS